MPASLRTRYQSRRRSPCGRDASSGDGNTNGPCPLGCVPRMRRACELRGTFRGPVLLSSNSRASPRTSDQRSPTISPLRHPVRSNRRMMSACFRHSPPRSAYSSRTPSRRATSSRDRKRVSGVRRFFLTPRAGLVSMWPHAIAKFRICRRMSRVRFAPPGEVRLYVSNHRLTSAGAMRSRGFDPKAGRIQRESTIRIANSREYGARVAKA